jgi:hypothetical protein
MKTVWMQRWARAALAAGTPAPRWRGGRPAYVDRRVTRLAALRRAP